MVRVTSFSRSGRSYGIWGSVAVAAALLLLHQKRLINHHLDTQVQEPNCKEEHSILSDKIAVERSDRSNSGKGTSSVWDVKPFEHTEHVEIFPGYRIDGFNPFHKYLQVFSKGKMPKSEFPDLPLFDTWIHYLEAYHNHFHRFRSQERVVFMEIGVQSGGKIALLRDYFGPKFEYVGIDINPSTKMFESADWVHIEIGDSANPEFLKSVREKYPHVDIFLDDGGHTMIQQKVALREMLPHVQPEGVYIVEDLATSWTSKFGGVPQGDARNEEFLTTTMFGLIHQTIDWLHAQYVLPASQKNTREIPDDDFFPESWWRMIPEQVKHIHVYNQIVVYEKGVTHRAKNFKTVGKSIPYKPSGSHELVQWDELMKKIRQYTNSPNTW